MRKLLILLLFASCSESKSPAPPPIPYVSITKPQIADVPLYLDYIGHVEAHQTALIRSQAEGILMGQFFKEGQEVEKNDILLMIDPSPYQAALDKAQAELVQNLADHSQAKNKVDRYTRIVKEDYVSELNYDQMVTTARSAEAAVQQSYAQIEMAQINLNYCTIRAPFSGVTGKLLINVGNYVPVGGDPLLTLNQITPIRVTFHIPESDLCKIAPLHQKNTLKAFAFQHGESIEGELYLIDNKVNESTGTILLQALFANKDKKLWPGGYLEIRLILDTLKNAVLIPNQAIQIGQDGSYIYVLKSEETVELRKITLGQKSGDHTVIDKGLSPEETVVLEGQLNLYPGAKIRIK